jgi:hypothetical protein
MLLATPAAGSDDMLLQVSCRFENIKKTTTATLKIYFGAVILSEKSDCIPTPEILILVIQV